ncbi:MAG: photosynthetic complex assembly protein PuhC [Hyphomicrobiales bacterium]
MRTESLGQRNAAAPPKLPSTVVIAFICASLVFVAAARIGGVPPSPGPMVEPGMQTPEAARLLRFADAPDGSVRIFDAETGEQIAVAAPGTNHFLRGLLRGLNRARKSDGASYDVPFLLQRWPHGRMVLIDTHDGVALDLMAYGQTNAASFEPYLKHSDGGQQ